MTLRDSKDDAPLRHAGRIALVDDDAFTRRLMRGWLEASGWSVLEFASGTSLLEEMPDDVSAVCLDLELGDIAGLHVLQHLRTHDPDLPVLVVTAERELETAVECMRAGAYDYLAKPLDRPKLTESIARALSRYEAAVAIRSQRASTEPSFVGRSASMQSLWQQIERVLESDVTVCVFGESGTGKELVAQAIHARGRRRRGPFVAINCASIPAALQESELFGHERGAFTGAVGAHRGRFEQASGGTLFLDELGEMSASTQAALLRALQERKIRRVGGTTEVPIDVRVVCATHRDLAAEVKAGRFREDLYFRLVVYPLQVPPLRERLDDIPLLIGHFSQLLKADAGREIHRVSADALDALTHHHWPGNVRELQNVVHRAMLACDGDQIELSHLPLELRAASLPSIAARPQAATPAQDLRREGEPVLSLVELERRAIMQALEASGGNVGKAAKLLGLGRATLYRRLASLGLHAENA